MSVSDIEKIPENAKLIYQDHTIIGWEIDAKGGEESEIIGHFVLAKPTVSYGIFSYSAMAHFSQPDFGRVSKSVTIYLDSSGMQVEEGIVKTILKTGFPAPTPPPDLTIIPETPIPTVAWPTATPFSLPMATQPAYPVPGKQISTERVNQKQPLPPSTQASYPNP